MKYLKELMMRFPLLIAALILALLSVYSDYSSQNENVQVNDVQVMENVHFNGGYNAENGNGKGEKGESAQNTNAVNGMNENSLGGNSSDENLYGSDLSGQNLYGSDLSENNLSRQKFSKKDLASRNIIGRNFYGSSIEIIKVIDGDSIRVRIDNSAPLDVRLYGIDAPEYKQKYGKKAQAFLYNMVNDSDIKNLEIIDIDRYDRLVAVLYFTHGMSAQEELLKNGMAWYYGRFCKIDALCLNYEKWAKDAKKAKLGLWADASPKAPWNWKKR